MRELTEQENKARFVAWQKYASEYATKPDHIWLFEHGFTAGLDHSAAQLAALTAERTQLRTETDALREACEATLDFFANLDSDGETSEEIEYPKLLTRLRTALAGVKK